MEMEVRERGGEGKGRTGYVQEIESDKGEEDAVGEPFLRVENVEALSL